MFLEYFSNFLKFLQIFVYFFWWWAWWRQPPLQQHPQMVHQMQQPQMMYVQGAPGQPPMAVQYMQASPQGYMSVQYSGGYQTVGGPQMVGASVTYCFYNI